MVSTTTLHTGHFVTHPQPGRTVVTTAWLMALWCTGFAGVSAWFEITGHFESGPYAAYASGISVMNWLVFGLKLVGAAFALLSVTSRPLLRPGLVNVVLWGIFSTLAVYDLGSVVEALAMITGLAGDPSQIRPSGIAYVLFFAVAATGFGLLTISHSRRIGFRPRYAVVGALGAPAVLGLVLLAVPTLLSVLGLLPES